MKEYYFSTQKHAIDIDFRYNRLTNLRARLESDGKLVSVSLERTIERLAEIRHYMAGACGRPIKLPADLYALAVDTIGWAASMR